MKIERRIITFTRCLYKKIKYGKRFICNITKVRMRKSVNILIGKNATLDINVNVKLKMYSLANIRMYNLLITYIE